LLAFLGLQGRDLSILFTDDRNIAKLNKKCFDRDRATNVISFSYLEGFQNEVLGDIIVSVERAEEEARGAGIPLHERLLTLTIHGLVHILGFDHEKGPLEARRMRYREKKLMDYIRTRDAYKEILL
jgi:rRNA maturation RNase YbeY